MPVISVRDLVKRYGGQPAVDGVSFSVEAGEVYGLLGENGAGKSTTVEILEGHRRRTSGDVRVLGEDPGFVQNMQAAFNPTVDAPAWNWSNLGVMALWGVFGVALAWRFFKWEPVADAGSPSRRGRRRRRIPE